MRPRRLFGGGGRPLNAGVRRHNPVSSALGIAFAICVAYAVLGNAAVYVVLLRRQVPVRALWAGTPGYLYRTCVDNPHTVSVAVRRVAFSTIIAFLIAMFLALFLFGFSKVDSQ